MPLAKQYSPAEALDKARRYCAVQERGHQEVRDKLYAWGLHRAEVEDAIGRLIGEGFLNEQRFAETFAVSKFHQKGWGRIKIEHELKARRISAPCIKLGLKAIDEEEYMVTLKRLVQRRWALEKAHTAPMQRQRVIRYLMSRGFELDRVEAALPERS
jgi:regulatory protein